MIPFRFAPIVCCLFFVAGLTACAGTNCQVHPENSSMQATLGEFSVSTVAAEAETDLIQPSLRYKNREISPASDPIRELTAGAKVENFPLPDCASMSVEMFTGGANCCFGYYLITSCADGDHAAYIEPRNGGLGEALPNLRAYPVDDPAFFYYEPQNQQGADKLALSRVESPRLTRLLVFADGAWRADIPGEFPAVYTLLLSETRKAKDMDKAARGISLAYYALMAGQKDDAAFKLLKRSLSQKHAPLASTIFTDIKNSVLDFAPVRNLVLGN